MRARSTPTPIPSPRATAPRRWRPLRRSTRPTTASSCCRTRRSAPRPSPTRRCWRSCRARTKRRPTRATGTAASSSTDRSRARAQPADGAVAPSPQRDSGYLVLGAGMASPLPRDTLRQQPLQVVEALPPAVLVRPHGLLVPEVAVGEADRRDALDLLEVDLDQLALVVAVPEPGEG